MEMKNNVCRFCLKLIRDANIELINDVRQEILGVLLIKLDLDVSEGPLVCETCLGIFDEIYMFKSNCLYSEHIISSHFESNLQVSLRDILIELKNEPNIAENEVVCRLCLKVPTNDSYIALNKTGEEISLCRDMLLKQLPEINLNITKESVICGLCHASLKKYFSFVRSCLHVEEMIKTYCKLQENNVKKPVNLLCVLQFTENKGVDCENNFNEDLIVKQEESPVHSKVQKVDDVEKDNLCEDYRSDDSSTEVYIMEEKIEIKTENSQISLEMGENDQLHDFDSLGKSGSLKNESEDNTQFCPESRYSSENINSIESHIENSHDKLWKCCLCLFNADNLLSLNTHMTSHKGPTNMLSCTECPYMTSLNHSFIQHYIKHKDMSEVEMHKCPLCPFETRYIGNLQKHQSLQHEENIRVYQCAQCSWSTKYRGNHIHHLMLHKMVDANERFSCDQCNYSTHTKGYLIRHMRQNHTGARLMLQCDQCDYRTKNRRCFCLHKNRHDPTQPKFKCDKCEYWSYYRSKLNRHLVTHMQLGETAAYHCAGCDFKSKYKWSLQNHMKKCSKEEDGTDSRPTLQCDQCDFHTKCSKSLSMHKKTHDPTEHRFKCEQCEYSTYRPYRLRQHLVTHMELEEAAVYHCAKCDFKSKYKRSLTGHIKRCSNKKFIKKSK